MAKMKVFHLQVEEILILLYVIIIVISESNEIRISNKNMAVPYKIGKKYAS